MIADLKPYPDYKDSGLPWVGQVPAHWNCERAKWLFTQMNRPVREEDEVVTCFRDGTVTLRKNRRLRGFTEASVFSGYQGIRKGDFVIHGMDAFAGAIGVSDSDGKSTPVYNVCRPKMGVNAYFYAHVVREMSQSQWILALAKGIRERSTDFRFEMFGNQRVLHPPEDEQAAIVRFLDWANSRLERTIRAKRKVIALLNEQKQAIIHRVVTRGLDPDVSLKDSGISWIGAMPSHWEILSLKRVLRGLVDCEHKTAPRVDGTALLVVRTTAVRGGELRLHGTYPTSEEAFRLWTRRAIPEAGDVIFTREAPAGEACVIPKEMNVCLGQRTVLIKPNPERIDSQFLIHMIYGGPTRLAITLASQGSTVAHFNMSDIGAMTVFLPPIEEQLAIVDAINERTKSIVVTTSRLENEIELLREYRTRLVADVVTGKLDVRAIAATLPDAPVPGDDNDAAFDDDTLDDALDDAPDTEDMEEAA